MQIGFSSSKIHRSIELRCGRYMDRVNCLMMFNEDVMIAFGGWASHQFFYYHYTSVAQIYVYIYIYI